MCCYSKVPQGIHEDMSRIIIGGVPLSIGASVQLFIAAANAAIDARKDLAFIISGRSKRFDLDSDSSWVVLCHITFQAGRSYHFTTHQVYLCVTKRPARSARYVQRNQLWS